MPSALISVSDKSGLIPFVRDLVAAGWDIIASGGTATTLQQAGLDIRPVADLTGIPALLDGRVKTLHPAIHAGILARDTSDDRATLQNMHWPVIDMVVANLYPFVETTHRGDATHAEIIENIDIGGVALLRAAAKNHARVLVVCDPDDYSQVLQNIQSPDYRARMALKAFSLTADYDQAISAYLAEQTQHEIPLVLHGYPALVLRYGENPHQKAQFFASQPGGQPFDAQLLQGKALSYNNLLDLDGALSALAAFTDTTVVIVKHCAPCGIASAASPAEAFNLARASDPVSAYGSVIVCNQPIDLAFAEQMNLFVECLLAPDFTLEAKQHFQKRRNLRLLQIDPRKINMPEEFRSIPGGWISQQRDVITDSELDNFQIVTDRQPDTKQLRELQFAWKACLSVKSNAVLLASSSGESLYTLGIGGGQPNRVDCVHLAARRAGEKASGAVLASDGFFPFADGIEATAAAGVQAIIQPGGSIRDQECIDAANQLQLSMLFTGRRHFRH